MVLPYYIKNYKGGRNERFMYGYDEKLHDMIMILLGAIQPLWPD